jgi:colanic acid/amylovoran biosynthesis protein
MKILLLNLHSALNLGDDAIMQATLRTLREAYPDAQIAVAANDPGSWQKYDDIEVLSSLATGVADPAQGRWRKRAFLMPLTAGLLLWATAGYRLLGARIQWGTPEQRRLLNCYYDADLILSCGGGNFYAHRSLSPALIWALLTLAFAVGLGKPVVMLPQSFGPIEGQLQRRLAHWTFNRVRLIMARERRSIAFVTDTLRVATPVVLVPDLAFGLAQPVIGPVRHVPPRVGVTVIDRGAQSSRFRGQQGYEDTLVTLLVRLAHEHDAQIHIFCQCYGPSPDQDDRLVARRVYERITQRGVETNLHISFRDARDIIAAYGELDLLVGTRMHTGIFALCNAVPVLLIGYQPKACGVMASFDLDRYCCDIANLDADALYALACELLQRQAELRGYITKHLTETLARASTWIDFLKGI